MLVPLYGFVEGDTMGILVLASADMTIDAVCQRMRESAHLRAGSADGEGWELFDGDRRLAMTATLTESGLSPLRRVDLRRTTKGAP